MTFQEPNLFLLTLYCLFQCEHTYSAERQLTKARDVASLLGLHSSATRDIPDLSGVEPDGFLLNIALSFSQVLSLQHSGSDSSHSQFASYWKPILSMDANFWQRWLHMHRIVLLLEHDTYVTGRAELMGTLWASLGKQGVQFSPAAELQLSWQCLWPREGPCWWYLVDGEGSFI